MQLANFFLLKFFKNSRKILLKNSNTYFSFILTAKGCTIFKQILIYFQPYINFVLIAITQRRFFNFFSLASSFSLNIKRIASSLSFVLSFYFFITTIRSFSSFFKLTQLFIDHNFRLNFCCINNRFLITDFLQRFSALFLLFFSKYYFFRIFIFFQINFRALLT